MKTVSGKEALLIWCQNNTQGYKDVNVTNFTTSWQDGLAFCALLHRFHPDKINFTSLKKENKADNLELAFSVAESLGIPSLLDVEDMILVPKPEPFSVITYLSQYYHKLSGSNPKAGGIASINASSSDPPSNQHVSEKSGPDNNEKKDRWLKQENERKMQENQKKLNELQRRRLTGQFQNAALNCAKCGLPLEGETVELKSANKEYHKNCFGCHTCGKKLGLKPIVVVDNPYCEQCGKKAFIKSHTSHSKPTSSNSPVEYDTVSTNPSPSLISQSSTSYSPLSSSSSNSSLNSSSSSLSNSWVCTKCGNQFAKSKFCGTCGNPNPQFDQQKTPKQADNESLKQEEQRMKIEREKREDKERLKQEEQKRVFELEEKRKRRELEEKQKRETEEKMKQEERKKKQELEERERREREEKIKQEEKKKREELEEKQSKEREEKIKQEERERKERERIKQEEEEEERKRKESEKQKKEDEERLKQEQKRVFELEEQRKRRESEEKQKKEREEKMKQEERKKKQELEERERREREEKIKQEEKKKREELEEKRSKEREEKIKQEEITRRELDEKEKKEKEERFKQLEKNSVQNSSTSVIFSCSNCGNKPSKGKFCTLCGAKLTIQTTPSSASLTPERTSSKLDENINFSSGRDSIQTKSVRDASPPARLKKDSNSSSTEPQWISQAKKYQKRWSLEKNEIDKPIQQEKTAPPLPPKKPKNENLDSKTPPSLPKNPPHSTSFIQRKPPGENVSLDNKFSKSSKTFMEEPRKNPQLGQETVGVREGFLTKMGEVHKNWKRRYFKLTETSLEYYSPTQIYGFFSNANPLGTIALKGCFINRVSEEQIGKKFCFSIDPPTLTRTYFIYADTEVEMENWIYSIQQVITSLAPKSRGSIIEIRKKNQSFMSAKKSGWLLKQETVGGMIFFWVRTKYSIVNDGLAYWASGASLEGPPSDSISLRNITSVEPAVVEKTNVFKIIYKDGSELLFQAESEAEMMSWIESLLQIVCLITYEEQEMKKNADSTPQMKLFEGTLDYLTFFYMWSPRYVSIRAGVLYIFDVASKKRTGKYALYKSEVAPYISENKSYANSFQLTVNVGTSPEILYFKAKDKQELNQWINNINLQKKEIEHIIDSILQ